MANFETKIKNKFNTKTQGTFQTVSRAIENIVYRMYLQDGWQLIQMPINPETFKTTANGNLDNQNIVGIGDIIRPKAPQLRTFTWSGLFMADYFDPLNSAILIYPPQFYVKWIEGVMKKQKPIKFMNNTISMAMSFIKPSNYKVLIEKFEYEERGGEPGDIYYTISLKEYREYGIKQIDLNIDETAGVEGVDVSEAVQNVQPREKLEKVITTGGKFEGVSAIGVTNGGATLSDSISITPSDTFQVVGIKDSGDLGRVLVKLPNKPMGSDVVYEVPFHYFIKQGWTIP